MELRPSPNQTEKMDGKPMVEIKIPCTMTQLISVCLMLALAGCAMNRNQKAVEMERLLAAAGFKMRLADTKSKLAQLKKLPQRKLVAQNWGGQVSYVYADAANCKCAYVGDEEAYKHFQDLALQRQISEEDRRAAEQDQPADMEGGGWRFDKPW
jgi:hypothetical protein